MQSIHLWCSRRHRQLLWPGHRDNIGTTTAATAAIALGLPLGYGLGLRRTRFGWESERLRERSCHAAWLLFLA